MGYGGEGEDWSHIKRKSHKSLSFLHIVIHLFPSDNNEAPSVCGVLFQVLVTTMQAAQRKKSLVSWNSPVGGTDNKQINRYIIQKEVGIGRKIQQGKD